MKHVRKRRKQSTSKKERHKHTRKLNALGHSIYALQADIADFVMGGGAGGGVTSESEVDESAEAAKVTGWKLAHSFVKSLGWHLRELHDTSCNFHWNHPSLLLFSNTVPIHFVSFHYFGTISLTIII